MTTLARSGIVGNDNPYPLSFGAYGSDDLREIARVSRGG